MTPKEMAARLDGRQHTKEVTQKEIHEVKDSQLVVMFAWPELTIIYGVTDNTVYSHNCDVIYLDKNGLVKSECSNPQCPYFLSSVGAPIKITPVVDVYPYDWQYRTDIPHETFTIYSGFDKWCLGIVFSLDDLPDNKSGGFHVPTAVQEPQTKETK